MEKAGNCKGCLKLSLFLSSHIDGIACVKQIKASEDIREIIKFYRNELRL